MPTPDFQIDFSYDGISYYGLVHSEGPESSPRYRVNLESENQETFLDILLIPATSDLEDWTFQCGEGEDASKHYETTLLEEIGEQVESCLRSPKSF